MSLKIRLKGRRIFMCFDSSYRLYSILMKNQKKELYSLLKKINSYLYRISLYHRLRGHIPERFVAL